MCVCVCVCDRESSIMRRTWHTSGRYSMKKKIFSQVFIGNHCLGTHLVGCVIALRYVLQRITAGLFLSNRLYRSEYVEGVVMNIIMGQ